MKKILLFLWLSFCLIQAHATSTAYFKVANTGTLEKIEKVSAGGYITLGTDSNYQLQVVRWDNNFTPLWNYKFTASNLTAGGLGLVEANDGSFFIMCISNSHSGCTMITKISSSGTILWQRDYYANGGNLNSFALSKACGNDNGFVIGGGQAVVNNYLIKCDANGNIQWQQQYYYLLATGVITCWSIIPDGNNYVMSSNYNINSLLTIRVDSAGGVLAYTAYTYSTMQIRPTRMVKLNSSNGYAILGNYNNSNNNQTQFLAILSNSLSMLSFNELTISGYDQFELHDITAINNGQNLILDGSIYDNSTFYIATMNVSNGGTIVWKMLGTGNTGTPILNVEFTGVTSLGNSTVHVGDGYYEGAIVGIIDSAGNGLCNPLPFNVSNVSRTLALQSSTLFTVTGNALTDTATYAYTPVVYFNQYFYCGNLPTGISDNEKDNSEIEIFPSPASTELRIKSQGLGTELKIEKVEMYDLLGDKIFSQPTANNQQQLSIDVSHLLPGIYFVRLYDGAESVSKKVIIQH